MARTRKQSKKKRELLEKHARLSACSTGGGWERAVEASYLNTMQKVHPGSRKLSFQDEGTFLLKSKI